ncbi:uncharacterized protein KIAA1614 homolog [Rhinophrynus dorsalis]
MHIQNNHTPPRPSDHKIKLVPSCKTGTVGNPRSQWTEAEMAAEVNMRKCLPHKDIEKRQSNKSPRRTNHATGKGRGNEHAGMSGILDVESVMRNSVLQCKVKALKEKQKESRTSEYNRGEGVLPEDALVTPQLRTYLTEEALNCDKPGKCSDDGQDTWGYEEHCGTSNSGKSEHGSDSPSLLKCSQNSNESKTQAWTQEQLQTLSLELPCAPQPEGDFVLDCPTLSLAERVEKNRQELRWKFNNVVCHNIETSLEDTSGNSHAHTSKHGSWIFPGDVDGDSGVSLPDPESCRELSVRHEQAKQLLHRARMKAKGASPLRASHCVLQHPLSQPLLRRGPCASGALTDGGSLSDSSGSDYCSWQRSFRGSSPSHVRFQDESERDAEERYRERQQQSPQTPCVNITPPPKRHSNGHVSWTQQLLPSGNGQCGTCGSYINGSGEKPNSDATSQGTNNWNVQLGTRIPPQEGPHSSPLGVKPSPHWILPSQPWRIHTELIRETHIGGDSTADSSGEEEGSRGQSKSCHAVGTRRRARNNPQNAAPDLGTRTYLSNLDPETENRGNLSNFETGNESRISTHNSTLQPRAKPHPSCLRPDSRTKISESNLATETVTSTSLQNVAFKPGIRTNPHYTEARTTINYGNPDPGKESSTIHEEAGFGNTELNVDAKEGTKHLAPSVRKTHTDSKVPFMAQTDSSLVVSPAQGSPAISGRMPVPPAGRAPTTVPSRTGRFTMRSEGTVQLLPITNSQEVTVMQKYQDEKKHQPNPVPKPKKKNQETLRDSDNQHESLSCTRSKEKSRERAQKSKKLLNNEKPNEVQEQKNPESLDAESDKERTFRTRRQMDCEKPHSFKGHQDAELPVTIRDQEGTNTSRDQMVNASREQKGKGRTSKGGHMQHANNANIGEGMRSGEISFHSQISSQETSVQDKLLCQEERGTSSCVAPHGPMQSAVKKGDLRSGMKKILSTFGLTSRPRLERFQSSSLEQIFTSPLQNRDASADADNESCDGGTKPGGMKKSPSLQSLKLMSPFNLPRKASSVQTLLGKSDRSTAYVTGDANTAPRRALSVEDIGSPDMPRSLGRVVEVYPDGTRLLELQRPPHSSFGFIISSGTGRPDSGIYVQEMSNANTAKLYSGLLCVGDEILELNGTKVSTLGPAQLSHIIGHEVTLLLRVLHQRRTKC